MRRLSLLACVVVLSASLSSSCKEYASKDTETTALLGLLLPLGKGTSCGLPGFNSQMFIQQVVLNQGFGSAPWATSACKPIASVARGGSKSIGLSAGLNRDVRLAGVSRTMAVAGTIETSQATTALKVITTTWTYDANGNNTAVTETMQKNLTTATYTPAAANTTRTTRAAVSDKADNHVGVQLLSTGTTAATADETEKNAADVTAFNNTYSTGTGAGSSVCGQASTTAGVCITVGENCPAGSASGGSETTIVTTNTKTYDSANNLTKESYAATCGGNAMTFPGAIWTKEYTYNADNRPLTVTTKANLGYTRKHAISAAATATQAAGTATVTPGYSTSVSTNPVSVITVSYTPSSGVPTGITVKREFPYVELSATDSAVSAVVGTTAFELTLTAAPSTTMFATETTTISGIEAGNLIATSTITGSVACTAGAAPSISGTTVFAGRVNSLGGNSAATGNVMCGGNSGLGGNTFNGSNLLQSATTASSSHAASVGTNTTNGILGTAAGALSSVSGALGIHDGATASFRCDPVAVTGTTTASPCHYTSTEAGADAQARAYTVHMDKTFTTRLRSITVKNTVGTTADVSTTATTTPDKGTTQDYAVLFQYDDEGRVSSISGTYPASAGNPVAANGVSYDETGVVNFGGVQYTH